MTNRIYSTGLFYSENKPSFLKWSSLMNPNSWSPEPRCGEFKRVMQRHGYMRAMRAGKAHRSHKLVLLQSNRLKHQRLEAQYQMEKMYRPIRSAWMEEYTKLIEATMRDGMSFGTANTFSNGIELHPALTIEVMDKMMREAYRPGWPAQDPREYYLPPELNELTSKPAPKLNPNERGKWWRRFGKRWER